MPSLIKKLLINWSSRFYCERDDIWIFSDSSDENYSIVPTNNL